MVYSEMEKPTVEEVLERLDTLYRSESTTDKEAASSWLIRLHSSVSTILIKAHQL